MRKEAGNNQKRDKNIIDKEIYKRNEMKKMWNRNEIEMKGNKKRIVKVF